VLDIIAAKENDPTLAVNFLRLDQLEALSCATGRAISNEAEGGGRCSDHQDKDHDARGPIRKW